MSGPGGGSGRGPERFQAERRALRKIQVHFELRQSLMREVRVAAAKEGLSSTDYVRRLVGLPYAKIQRPRISLSFSERDLQLLAARYGRPATDPGAIKRGVLQEIRTRFDGAAGEAAGPERRRRGGG